MKKIEKLFCSPENEVKHEYESIRVDKIQDDNDITILVRNMALSSHRVLYFIKYESIGEEYVSPLLSWKNLILCSRCYGVAPNYNYMNHAVQNGLKTACTAYANGAAARHLIRSCPDDCYAASYTGFEDSIVYVCRKGCLNDYFEYDVIKEKYRAYHIFGLDWNKIRDYFSMDLQEFVNPQKCGIDLQDGGDHSDDVIRGLVLGYPVESTIAWIDGSDHFPPRDGSKDWRDESNYLDY